MELYVGGKVGAICSHIAIARFSVLGSILRINNIQIQVAMIELSHTSSPQYFAQ